MIEKVCRPLSRATRDCLFNSYSFPWIAPLPLALKLIMLSVKQEDIKYHFLSLSYESTRDWTPVLRTIGQDSNHYAYRKENINRINHIWTMGLPVCICLSLTLSLSLSLYIYISIYIYIYIYIYICVCVCVCFDVLLLRSLNIYACKHVASFLYIK